ncbi:MAG: neutral/alkaline non-lysosomal ceramidase N-terminal domain-containing protein [Bacteroidota bacterium]
MRKLLKILGVLCFVILISLVWALERVDYTPWFESGYYSETRSSLDSLSQRLDLAYGKVEVGFGRAGITPGMGALEDDPVAGVFREIPMAGYGNRKGAPAEGVHDSLFVKAMAIRVEEQLLVLVASDMVIVPPNVTEGVSRMVAERIGLSRSQLLFSATHTHSGVGGWSDKLIGKGFSGETNPNVSSWLINRFSQAIEDAVTDLQPGELGSGSFMAPGLISNRLVGEKGEENSEFIFVVARQNGGKSGVLGSFDAHATTLGGDNMLLSGDYPGYWQRKLESEGFDMALFFAGSVGSHSAKGEGEGFEKSGYIGEALADSLLQNVNAALIMDSIGLASMTLPMHLPEMHFRVTDGLRLNPVISKKLFPPMGEVHLQAVRIGNLIWITAPCDFSGELAIRYKSAMYREGYRAMVTSFNGAYLGYIIPGKYYHMNAYESRFMSWFGPNMGPYTDEMIRRMTETLSVL